MTLAVTVAVACLVVYTVKSGSSPTIVQQEHSRANVSLERKQQTAHHQEPDSAQLTEKLQKLSRRLNSLQVCHATFPVGTMQNSLLFSLSFLTCCLYLSLIKSVK